MDVRGPVSETEESKHYREDDARDDVDALGARREIGNPRPPAVRDVLVALHVVHRVELA